MPYKHSSLSYRNIKGVRYESTTSNPDDFETVKKECKEAGLKFRMVNTTCGPEIFVEVKKGEPKNINQ